MSYRDAKPTFKDLKTDRAGHLFVRSWETYGSGTVDWLVFNDQGHLQGTLPVPADIEILEIGDDYVIAVWKNELDAEFVRVYDLTYEGRDVIMISISAAVLTSPARINVVPMWSPTIAVTMLSTTHVYRMSGRKMCMSCTSAKSNFTAASVASRLPSARVVKAR